MKGDHCRCCEHYQASWRVNPAPMFPGWFEAVPPTDDNRELCYFPTEDLAVEHARLMRDNPGLWYAGASRGRGFMEMLWLGKHGLLDKERCGS